MRKYLEINLENQSIEEQELNGLDVVRVGRHFIAKLYWKRGRQQSTHWVPKIH